jgi:hypothetical protein
MSDLVLRGGIVAGRRQDVLIRDGRIHRIAPDVGARDADGLSAERERWERETLVQAFDRTQERQERFEAPSR